MARYLAANVWAVPGGEPHTYLFCDAACRDGFVANLRAAVTFPDLLTIEDGVFECDDHEVVTCDRCDRRLSWVRPCESVWAVEVSNPRGGTVLFVTAGGKGLAVFVRGLEGLGLIVPHDFVFWGL